MDVKDLTQELQPEGEEGALQEGAVQEGGTHVDVKDLAQELQLLEAGSEISTVPPWPLN